LGNEKAEAGAGLPIHDFVKVFNSHIKCWIKAFGGEFLTKLSHKIAEFLSADIFWKRIWQHHGVESPASASGIVGGVLIARSVGSEVKKLDL